MLMLVVLRREDKSATVRPARVRAWAAALDFDDQPNTRHLRHTPLIHRDRLATTVHMHAPNQES